MSDAMEFPLQIACVGDSNTVGTGLPNEQAYPFRLQAFLGDLVKVASFGRVAATAGKPVENRMVRYADTKRCSEALEHHAHVYICMLGVNDARVETRNMRTDLKRLVQKLRSAAGGAEAEARRGLPAVLLVLPRCLEAGRSRKGTRSRTELFEDKIWPAVRKVADGLGPFCLVEPELSEDCFQPDRVHLSSQGAAEVARAVGVRLLELCPLIEQNKVQDYYYYCYCYYY